MTESVKLLLVEDDERIRRELLDALRASGFEVEVSVNLRTARQAVERPYDLILLDLGLPDGDGLDLCRELRAGGRNVPVLILTARDLPEQRVRGLDVGADDYVVKPFHLPELIARVRTILRRAHGTSGAGRAEWRDLTVDPESRRVERGGRELSLTRREFDLLLFLLQAPGRTWTRDQLLARVWGSSYDGDARTVDLHIRRLRAKIEDDPGDPRYLETVWGVGYRLGDA